MIFFIVFLGVGVAVVSFMPLLVEHVNESDAIVNVALVTVVAN